MEEKTNKSHKKSYDWLKPYQFGPGNNANPNGRPKGKTLKEFAREYLQSLPDDRKIEYLATLPEDVVWKMAEGNPTSEDTLLVGELPQPILDAIPKNHSNLKDTEPNQED